MLQLRPRRGTHIVDHHDRVDPIAGRLKHGRGPVRRKVKTSQINQDKVIIPAEQVDIGGRVHRGADSLGIEGGSPTKRQERQVILDRFDGGFG